MNLTQKCIKKRFRKIASFVFALTLFLGLSSQVIAQSDGLPRGSYQMPYTRYESEDANRGSGANYYSAFDFDQNNPASEASNQQYVGLPSNGSFVEWTVNESGRGVTMRFTMPDNESTGEGQTGSLDVYVNNNLVKTIDLTSRYAYQYFNTGVDKCEQIKGGTTKTRMRFDEVHFLLNNAINAGDVIKIQKGNGDAFEYGVDFIEIEPVPAPKAAPANSVSVTDFGANGNDTQDDLAAFHAALDAADAAGQNVYVPEGKYYLSAKLNFNVSDMIFQGAGIWYTEIYFSTDLQFMGGFYSRCNNVVISDFYLNTANNDRWNYNEPFPEGSIGEYKTYKGFMGTYGNNSTISQVWVEHFECGAWIAGYDAPLPVDITSNLTMTGMRIRNNYADGVNFCQGTNNSTVEHSNIRNGGDDGLAVWPNNAMGVTTPGSNNTFRYNTIENQWRAGGTALFGASGHSVHHSIYKDGFASSAIRLTTDFSGYKFDINTGINIYENTIISFGTSNDLWNCQRGALEMNATGGSIQNVTFENIDIYNSQRHAIQFGSGGGYTNINLNNITVDGTGLDSYTASCSAIPLDGCAIFAYATSGSATFTNFAYSNVENDPAVYSTSQGFTLNMEYGEISVSGVDITDGPIELVVGETVDLIPNISPSNATNKAVSWSSSNSSVGVVDPNTQQFTASSTGTTVITVSTNDGAFTDQVTINVSAAVNIEANDSEADENGDTGQFTISINDVSSDINVGYTVSGSASTGDFSSSPALTGSVTLTAANPSATITITPLNDSEFEGSETLTLTLNAGSGYQLGGSTTATVTIADNDNAPCSPPNIGMVNTAPVIDQNIDAIWNEQGSNSITNTVIGSIGSFSGSYKAVFDNTNLYLLVQTNDASLHNDSGTEWWNDDVIGIYLDGNNSKGTSYDGINDFQLGFRYNDSEIHIGGNSVQNTTGIDFEIYDNGSGLTLEVAIPWSTIGVTPEIGNQIGIDVICDLDNDGGTRDAQVATFATSEMAWSDPSLFGTAYLTSCGDVVIANAGVDQNLAKGTTSTTLTGAASSGPGTLSYSWTQVSGASTTIVSSNSESTSVTGLTDGNTYTFQLAVTSDGITSTDVVVVNVGSNQSPTLSVSNASVQLPNNTATLNAVANDSDGSIATYAWSQISGPTSASLSGQSSASLTASELVEGVYSFSITVTDNDGSQASDQATITVTTEPVYETDRGYFDAPYTRYESEAGSYGSGAAVEGPTYDMSQLASEATDRMFVNLASNGSFVEWTVNDNAQDGLTLRYSIPDNSSGTVALYVNGNKVQDISLSSNWSWQYFDISPSTTGDPSNTPSGANPEPRMRFDELHFMLPNSVNTGDVIRLQKDNNDGVAYGIDFIELEAVPAAISKPSGYISITDYGAIPNDGVSDDVAFRTAIDIANGDASITGIYIPAGRFINGIGSGSPTGNLWVGNTNLTIQGAGMWHTEIYFSSLSTDGAGFLFDGSNIHLKDFYMNSATNSRTAGNKAINGSLGTGSSISNVWAEHFETGFWISSMNNGGWNVTDGLVISNCRIRNVYADGVNLAKGTSNTTVEHTSFRNCIDDAMATWSVNYLEAVPAEACHGNIFRYNTVENNLRAAGLGFFGGYGHQAHHLLIKDNFAGPGVRVNSQFPAFPFGVNESQSIDISDVTIIGAGTTKNIWTYRFGAIDLELPTPTSGNMYSVQYVNFTNVDVINSQHDAIFIHSYMPSENSMVLNEIYMNNVNINGTGVALDVNNGPQYDGSGTETGGHGIYVANYSTANVFDGWIEFDGAFSNIAGENVAYYGTNGSFEVRLSDIPEVPVTDITINPSTTSLSLGTTQLLTATISPTNATDKTVSWSSNNEAVVTVNNGTITAQGVGTAIVSATSSNGLISTCTVTVFDYNEPVTGISVSPTSVTLNAVGATQQLTATVSPANATNQSVTWSSSNNSAATVNSTGLVTAVTDGIATITVTTVDGGYTANSIITVDIPEVEQTPFGGTPWAIPGTIEAENYDEGGQDVAYNDADAANNGGQYRTAEAVDVEVCNDSGYNVGWTSSGEWMEYTVNVASAGNYDFEIRIASIYDAGTFHIEFNGSNVTGTITSINTGAWQTWTSVSVSDVALSAGEQIMRIALDNPNHNIDKVIITSADVTIPVTGISISSTGESMLVGETLQLSANVLPTNATNQGISWSTSNASVASVNNGLITANSEGEAVITVSSNEGNYSATCTVVVTGSGTGLTYYRIRNVWQSDQYLTDGGDRVTYSSLPANAGLEYEWILEDLGDGRVEIKNAATGDYMHIENLLGYIQCGTRTFGWWSSRWTISDAGNGESRIQNAWQSNDFIHVENTLGYAQYGGIYDAWASAKWVLESRLKSGGFAQEQSTLTDVSIYPNPVENTLFIEASGSTIESIRITDISGRSIDNISVDTESSILTIDMTNMKSGIYFVSLISENGEVKTSRVIKQ